jgi:hypothetical protein
MPALQLHVPRQTLDHGVFIDLRPRQVQQWIAQLPTANVANAAQQILRALIESNRVRMSREHRHQVLDTLRPPAEDLIASLKKRYANATPLTDKRHLLSIRLVNGLLEQLANGYKVILSDTVRSAKKGSAAEAGLLDALAPTMDCLARRLVETYHLYVPEPPGLWGDLHLLYLLAERHGVATHSGQPAARQTARQPSIEHRYKELLLLALANPYHLMRGEAERIHRDHLAAWARKVQLLPLTPGQVPAQRFSVDFTADAPPRYAPSNAGIAPRHGRVVETADLIPVVERMRHEQATFPFDLAMRARSTLTERLDRQMCCRLIHAWRLPRAERLEQRLARHTELYLIAGLSTCHHLFSDSLRVITDTSTSDGRVIVEATAAKQAAADSSSQPAELPPANGNGQVWAHPATASSIEIEADAEDAQPAAAEVREQQYVACAWRQRNESRDGIGLFLFGTCPPQVQVGELVAYGCGQPEPDAPWGLGIIRWARVHPGKSLELGIQTCSSPPLAVLTRAVEGTGKGGDFYKSLLLRPNGDQGPRVLMTPPALYDEGTVLSLQARGKTTRNVRLTKLTEATSRYAGFQFVDIG